MAIDEVLSQWVCEEINDVQNNKHRGVHSYEVGPLGSNVKYEADFSVYNGKPDVYSPLERFDENVSVTKEDVERAFDWLNRNVDFGENGGSVKEIE